MLEWVHAPCDKQYLLMFFCLCGSLLVVVLIKFVFNVFTSYWRDLMRSNIGNFRVSFSQTVQRGLRVSIKILQYFPQSGSPF